MLHGAIILVYSLYWVLSVSIKNLTGETTLQLTISLKWAHANLPYIPSLLCPEPAIDGHEWFWIITEPADRWFCGESPHKSKMRQKSQCVCVCNRGEKWQFVFLLLFLNSCNPEDNKSLCAHCAALGMNMSPIICMYINLTDWFTSIQDDCNSQRCPPSSEMIWIWWLIFKNWKSALLKKRSLIYSSALWWT